MSDLRERFGAYFGNINAAMTAFRNNEEWREAVLVEIENLVHAARAEEIEACAKVAEADYANTQLGCNPQLVPERIAAAIRARAPRART